MGENRSMCVSTWERARENERRKLLCCCFSKCSNRLSTWHNLRVCLVFH